VEGTGIVNQTTKVNQMSAWSMTASKGNGGPIEKAPAGTHPAVLVALIDLGTQWQPAFSPGEAGKYQHRLYWVYELPMEKKANGESHVIAIDLTWSLNEKAKMRQFIESRLGRKIAEGEKYDVSAELGQAVFLSVMANDKGYPKITNVSALPKSFTVTLRNTACPSSADTSYFSPSAILRPSRDSMNCRIFAFSFRLHVRSIAMTWLSPLAFFSIGNSYTQ
jgi:hypothetical protein